MPLLDNHRFTLKSSDGTTKQVEPCNPSFAYTLELDEENKIYRKKSNTDLLLTNDCYEFLFDNLEGCGCDKIEIIVERCCGREWLEVFKGFVTKYNIEWNETT